MLNKFMLKNAKIVLKTVMKFQIENNLKLFFNWVEIWFQKIWMH